jgi:ribose/xylose/arabinose/galactoside ABC-type transport system permease subunit
MSRPSVGLDLRLQLYRFLSGYGMLLVIAIVAIGMTMVIIAGGIDLSVGSLIALSAGHSGCRGRRDQSPGR